MKRLSLEEKYQRIRKVCCEAFYSYKGQLSSVGIHNFGLLHEIGAGIRAFEELFPKNWVKVKL